MTQTSSLIILVVVIVIGLNLFIPIDTYSISDGLSNGVCCEPSWFIACPEPYWFGVRVVRGNSNWKFFTTEPTKELRIAVDFWGVIASRVSHGGHYKYEVRTGMIDFLEELRQRGHTLILIIDPEMPMSYDECIEIVPKIESLFDPNTLVDRIEETHTDFYINDHPYLKNEGYILIPDPWEDYDPERNPFGWIDAVVKPIQDAGG